MPRRLYISALDASWSAFLERPHGSPWGYRRPLLSWSATRPSSESFASAVGSHVPVLAFRTAGARAAPVHQKR